MKRTRDEDSDDEAYLVAYKKTWHRQIPTRARARHDALQAASHTWLDELPLEIRIRVAMHVQSAFEEQPHVLIPNGPTLARISTNALLTLADASDRQRDAVNHVLSDRFELARNTDAKLASAMRSYIRHVDFGIAPANELIYLLHLPTLLSARISNRVHLLKAVSESAHLQELSVLLSSSSSISHLCTAMRKMKLKTLHLRCSRFQLYWRGMCLADLLRTPLTAQALAEACPYVKELEVVCFCNVRDTFDHVIEAFTNLDKLSFNVQLTDDMIPFLRRIPSVTCYFMGKSFERSQLFSHQVRYAAQIGASVVAVEQVPTRSSHALFYRYPPSYYFAAETTSLLSNCPRLRNLALRLKPGAEASLPKLHELQSVDLYWRPLNHRNLTRQLGVKEQYHIPCANFFHCLRTSSPHLKHLRLFKVRISMKEVRAFLKTYGTSLEVFGTSLIDQAEHPWERTLLIFDAVRRYNPELRHLDFCHTSRTKRATLYVAERRKWKMKVKKGVEVLHRCLPRLDVGRLYNCLRRALGERFPRARGGCSYYVDVSDGEITAGGSSAEEGD